MRAPKRTRHTLHKTSRISIPAGDPARFATGVWWRAALIVVAGLLAYANSLSGPFIYDDQLSIVENRQIREVWSAAVLFPERELPVAGRPLVNLSFAINYALGGLNVRGYHLGNIAIHVACALILFGIVRRTVNSADLGFAAALIWILHPLNTEAVDYITQRTESLMALCYLLTLYASIRARVPASARWDAAAIVACACGMACKESMVTAPVVVVLYDRIFLFGSLKEAFAARWRLYLGLAAAWLVLGALMWSGPRVHSAGFSTSTGTTPWSYLLNQTVMITQYLRRAVWPRSLVLNYGWTPAVTLTEVLPYAVFVSGLLAAAVVALVRWPRIGFLAACFFITLSPTSSIVPIATEVGAERRMYLPLIAIVVLGVLAATWLLRRTDRKVHVAVLVVVAAALGAGTIARNREYGSSLTLAQTVLDRYPTGIAHWMMGVDLMASGRHEEAEQHLRLAVLDIPRAHYSLGMELFNQGKPDEAIAQLREFIRKEPLVLEVISAHEYIGRAYARQRRWPEAAAEFRQILSKTPAHVEAQHLLANALFAQQAYDEAIEHYRRYLSARATDVEAIQNLGISLVATGKMDDALAVFRRALEVDPNSGAAARNLANALVDAGRPREAVDPARRAARLRPDDPAAHDLLGRALAYDGKFDEAVLEFERALQLDPKFTEAAEHLARIRAIR